MYIFINEDLDMFEAEDHSTVFKKYEETDSKRKAIFEVVGGVVKVVNTPLNIFDLADAQLKQVFKDKIKIMKDLV